MSVHIYNISEAIGNCAVGLMTVQRIAEFAEDFVLKPNGFLVPKSIYKIQSLSKVAPALAIATLPMIFSNTCSALEKICRGTSRDVVIDTLTIAGGAACMLSIGSYALCPEARFGITALGYGIDLAGLVYSGLSGADSRDLALQAFTLLIFNCGRQERVEFHNWVQDKFPPVNGQRAVLAGVNFSSLLLPFPEIKWFGSHAMEIFGGTPPLHQWAYSGVLTETALLGLSREYGLNKHTINDFLTSLYHTQLRTEIDPNTLDTFLRKFCDRPNILDEMLSSFSEEMQDAAQRNHSQHFFAALNFDEFLDVLEGRYEFNELVGRYNLLGEATEITKKDIIAHLAPISNTPYLLRLMFGSRISHMGVDFEILHEGKPLQTLAVQFGKKAAYIVEIQGRKHSPHEMLAFQAKTGLHPTEWLIQAVTLYLFEGRKVEFVRGLGAQRIPDCIKTRKMDHHEQVYYKAYDVAGMKKKKSNDVPNTRMRKRDSWNINDPFPHFQERGGWHPESVYQQMRATFAGIEKTVYAPEATPRFPFKY